MEFEQNSSIRIIITEPQPGASDDLQEQLSEYFGDSGNGNVDVVAVAHDGLEAAQMAAQLAPDVILLDEEMPGMSGYEAAELIALAAPDVASALMVPTGRVDDKEVARNALRAGARAVISPTMPAEQLVEVLETLAAITDARQRPEYELITDPEKMPVTIAITGAKGGIGKSMITINLAVGFARRHEGQTVLVDFYGQYSNSALMLDVSPSYDIGDLAAFAGELDSTILETHLTVHEDSGLKVLAGHPGGGGVGGQLGRDQEAAFLADLVGLLRRHYRFVFFDIPPLIGGASHYIFTRCQYIILVSTLVDLPTVRDTATLYKQLVDDRIASERIKLVINRFARSNELTVHDLEQAAGTRVIHQIPDDPAVAIASINEGTPAVISRGSSGLARGARELADLLEESMAEERRKQQRTAGA
jgi:pilus assembly protein CpaE